MGLYKLWRFLVRRFNAFFGYRWYKWTLIDKHGIYDTFYGQIDITFISSNLGAYKDNLGLDGVAERHRKTAELLIKFVDDLRNLHWSAVCKPVTNKITIEVYKHEN